MIVGYKTGFDKKTRRLSPAIRKAFAARLRLFMEFPFHVLLNNHPLTGKWRGYRSFNVTGDWRVIYDPVNADTAIFVDIDTHHNLYGT